jgi:ubiquinone/menaquinone biosynthesis C-methylase UbiE
MGDVFVPGTRLPSRTAPVQYDKVAATYQGGRALSDPMLAVWRKAVTPLLPTGRPLTVLDLGAGTGIFTRAWPRWCDCRVVALEPSRAMRATAAEAGIPEQAGFVAGVGEALPIRTGSVDVAWLFTVLHHLHDPHRCAGELRRVVVRGGLVVICGFFADRGQVGWLSSFPGAERARARFPSAAATVALFAGAGFEVPEIGEVESRLHESAGDAATWARQMRRADTLLASFSDADFEVGVATLEADPTAPIVNRLVLLAATKR